MRRWLSSARVAERGTRMHEELIKAGDLFIMLPKDMLLQPLASKSGIYIHEPI